MPTDRDAPIPGIPDPAPLIDAWMRVLTNGIDAFGAGAKRSLEAEAPLPFDPLAPMRAFSELATALVSDPAGMAATQRRLASEWTALGANAVGRLFGEAAEPFIAAPRGDRRFADPAWNDPSFDYVRQAYLLATRQFLEVIAGSSLPPAAKVRVDFFARQYLQAIAPSNFPLTNPEAMARAVETGGASLVAGFANLLEDAASADGLVRRRSADDFEVGVTLAATPGVVVHRNALMELIQYSPTTETVARRPLLYVPPLVNKYYVFDLQPRSSMIRWLVEQGRTVFVVSWVNPDRSLADKGIADYILSGPVEALDVIERATGERAVDLFGFCMGGTLATIAAAYLAGSGRGDRIASLTMIGTLLDFSDTGEWATFYEPGHLDAFERHAAEAGVIAAEKLQALFSLVRSNDLIWSSVVNHYLLDRVAPASDLLYWFNDGARIPQAFLLEYGRQLLRDDLLKRPGGMTLDGVAIDLGAVAAPAMLVSLKDDHVSGWQATYAGMGLLGGARTFLLGGSGHNAGVINPPSANKHGYWTNDAAPDTAEAWLEGATKQDGSWWPAWTAWLTALSDETVPARDPAAGPLPALGDAPGSYVRMR